MKPDIQMANHSDRKEVKRMRQFIGAVIAAVLLGVIPAAAESTVISPNGSRPSAKGAAANFTGDVSLSPSMERTSTRHRPAGT